VATKIPSAGSGLSVAQTAILAAQASDWFTSEVVAGQVLLPTLTKYRRIPLPIVLSTGGAAMTGDATVEGGGLVTTQNAKITSVGVTTFQTPKTGPWMLSGIVKLMGGGVTGHDSAFGLGNAAGTHVWWYGRFFSVSTTKYSVQLVGTSTPAAVAGLVNADNNAHKIRITFDGTTVNVYLDGTLDATHTTIAQMANEAMGPFFYSGTTGEAVLEDLMVGYIG
jgi:hypothetical protein